MLRLAVSYTLLLMLAVLVSACAGSTPEPVAQLEPVFYTLEMTEYAFSPERIEVKVGQEVTLELVNLGQISHELMVGQEVARSNNRPNGFHKDLFETAHVEPVISGGQLLVAIRRTGTVRTIPAASWWYCQRLAIKPA
jgi:plastocyanin